jgi:hypothetical protein
VSSAGEEVSLHRAVPVVLDGLDLDLSPSHLELGCDYDAVECNGAKWRAPSGERAGEEERGETEGGVSLSPRGLRRGVEEMFPFPGWQCDGDVLEGETKRNRWYRLIASGGD